MNIGEKIKELRLQSGLTQTQLAEKIGLTYVSICMWEKEKAEPTMFNCIVLADFFGITLDELCGRISAKTKKGII